jgi:3-oxoacyl-[acyl-carrier protein] reductase
VTATATEPRFPDLAGKVAIVTGGSKGIGRATCMLLARNGCRVAVVARSAGAVEEVVEAIRGEGGESIRALADASSAEDLEAVHRRVRDELGDVDLLLPYAGGFESFSRTWETSLEEWDTVLRVNLTSAFLAMREVMPRMIERRSGSIVLMSSISGRFLDKPTTASYAAAKAGVLMLMRHAAIEAGPYGVRINAIAPATVTSERIERIMDDEALARTAALSPLGRLGTPEDCAAASAFLASEASGWMTGVTLDVAGGRVML